MPHWMIKAFVQKTIAHLPARHAITEFVQTHVTRATRRLAPRFFEGKLAQAHKHLEHCGLVTGSSEVPAKVLELGTGWYPIVPVAFSLCGTSTLYSADREDLLRTDRVLEVLHMFRDYAVDGRLEKLLPRVRPERLALLDALLKSERATKPELLEGLGIQPMVADARHLDLSTGAVDMVFTCLVLGFIPTAVLPSIMTEFRRVVAPSGVMSHFIDLSDLYALFDRHITEYNFLRYSPRAWRLLNNNTQYLNRLRMSDYRRLHEEAGFRIVREAVDPGSTQQLARVPLDKAYRSYSPDDLAVRNAWIVSQPAVS